MLKHDLHLKQYHIIHLIIVIISRYDCPRAKILIE